jgi:hypothetical protein
VNRREIEWVCTPASFESPKKRDHLFASYWRRHCDALPAWLRQIDKLVKLTTLHEAQAGIAGSLASINQRELHARDQQNFSEDIHGICLK